MLSTARQEELFRRYSIAHAFSASLNVAAIGAANASALLHQTDELAHRQAVLQANLAIFDDLVQTEQRGALLPIRTIHLGSEDRAVSVVRQMLDNGFYTSAIFFPTVAKGGQGFECALPRPMTKWTFDGSAKLSLSADHGSSMYHENKTSPSARSHGMNAWFTKLLDLTALPGNADQICERLHQLTQEGGFAYFCYLKLTCEIIDYQTNLPLEWQETFLRQRRILQSPEIMNARRRRVIYSWSEQGKQKNPTETTKTMRRLRENWVSGVA